MVPSFRLTQQHQRAYPTVRKRKVNRRGPDPVLLALLWASFAVRVLTLEAQSLWRDEVDSIRFATQPLHDYLAQFTLHGQNGPLYFLLLRGWIKLAGTSVFALRFSSVLWGVVSVALLYTLMRRLHTRSSALCAALLLAFSPYAVWYAQEIRMYTWVPCLSLLALYALERAGTEPRPRWWLTVLIATSLAFYSHILAALLLPVEMLWFVLRGWSNRHARRGALLVLAGLTLPYLPLARWQLAYALMSRNTGYPPLSAWEMASILFTGWSSGISGWGAWPAVLAWSGLALLGLGALLRHNQGRLAGALGGWLALPWILIALVSLRGPIFTDRYLIWTMPAFYALAAIGLWTLQHKARILGQAVLALLLLINGSNLIVQAGTPIKPQFREATTYLREHYAADDVLVFQIPYNQHVMRYYWGETFPIPVNAPYTNYRDADGNYIYDMSYVDMELRRAALNGKRVWLIESEVELWDERGLVRRWFEQQGAILDEQRYHGIRLTLFQLRP